MGVHQDGQQRAQRCSIVTHQFSRSWAWNLLAQIGYVGTLTIHQHTRYNVNYGLPGGGTNSQHLYAPFGITAAETIIEPFEHMNYNSLQAKLQSGLTVAWSSS
jgi:hypothetical protein